MKISFFIGQLSGGGAEKVLTMLANHYSNGNDVDIVMLLGRTFNKKQFFLNKNVKIVDLSIEGSYIRNSVPWLIKIRRYLKSNYPDLIISFVGRINSLVLTASWGLSIPVIVSERSDPKNDSRGKIMLWYCDWIYRKANAIVFQTNYQRNCFSKKHEDRSYIIPNPVHILPLPDVKTDTNLLVTSGRLHPAKNHILLINAMARVTRVLPSAKCIIYGEGSLRNRLQEIINKKGLSDSVLLAGNVTNVIDYVAHCNIFVMSSNYEGLSNSLMEAMMLGKVCISTNYSGVEDLIENGVTGYVVPLGDDKAMADAILVALNNSDNRGDLIRYNARKKILSFEKNTILSKWDKITQIIIETSKK